MKSLAFLAMAIFSPTLFASCPNFAGNWEHVRNLPDSQPELLQLENRASCGGIIVEGTDEVKAPLQSVSLKIRNPDSFIFRRALFLIEPYMIIPARTRRI